MSNIFEIGLLGFADFATQPIDLQPVLVSVGTEIEAVGINKEVEGEIRPSRVDFCFLFVQVRHLRNMLTIGFKEFEGVF